jgi:G3E family GTPase
VLVETSGLSHVGPVAKTFFADAFVQRNFVLDAIVAVVDSTRVATHIESHMAAVALDGAGEGSEDDHDEEDDASEEISDVSSEGSPSDAGAVGRAAGQVAAEQIFLSDIILLNKQDMQPSEEERDRVEALVQKVNPLAKVLRCSNCRVPLDEVLGAEAFSVQGAVEKDALFLPHHRDEGTAKDSTHDHDHHHDHKHGAKDGESKGGHDHAGGHGHKRDHDHHDDDEQHAIWSSVGLQRDEDLDELAFCDWMQRVLLDYGSGRLYRAKGIVYFRGIQGGTIVQCVENHCEMDRIDRKGKRGAEGKGADQGAEGSGGRRSRLVFIGELASAGSVPGVSLADELTQRFADRP